jgi:PIN domain nuclease of toxin-antitoxin system
VRVLLDTHVLLWAKGEPDRLSPAAREVILDLGTQPIFSVASVWEVIIKSAASRGDFVVDADQLRRELLQDGFEELEVTAPHVLEVGRLPRLHGDPFDRLLVAQARVEDLTIMTADRAVSAYPVASIPA